MSKTLQFTHLEKEILAIASKRVASLPGMGKIQTIDLDAVPDTAGQYQVSRVRDLLANAMRAHFESLIGAGQWADDWYESARSAMLKIEGMSTNPHSFIPACTHPPTGILLRMWLLTGNELTRMQKAGLKKVTGRAVPGSETTQKK